MRLVLACLVVSGVQFSSETQAQRLGSGLWNGERSEVRGVHVPRGGGPFLDFEGLAHLETVVGYYNGGLGGFGSGPGPAFGVNFGPSAIALTEGNYSGNPSPPSVVIWLSGPNLFLNRSAGFEGQISFYYSAASLSGTVTIHSDVDGGGTLLETVELPVTPTLPSPPAGTGYYNNWVQVVVPFSGVARSVGFAGTANYIGFDDIVLGAEGGGFNCEALIEVVGEWNDDLGPCGNITSNASAPRYESALLDEPEPEALPRGAAGYTYALDFVQNRVQEASAATTLMVHGAPLPLQGPAQVWNRMLAFNISGNGRYSIYRHNGTARPVAVQKWATIVGASVAPPPASNRLEVVFDGSQLTFVLNGVPLRTVPTAFAMDDQFGIGFVRSRATTGNPATDDWLEVEAAQVEVGGARALPVISAAQAAENARANAQPGNGDPLYAPTTGSRR
ncbi:MAG: hypothetical protein IT479_11610 [Xanthomonadales bacterium]|nr:hypothetical protein [Xanthomonadales bacterium]